MRRWLLSILFLSGALLLGWGMSALRFRPPKPPNVAFIVLDALRADKIDGRRGATSILPGLHSFFLQSVAFKHAITPCTWTRPAMASLFTSTYLETHGVKHGDGMRNGEGVPGDVLPERVETMAEYFRAHGYTTACVQTNLNLTKQNGFAQGFLAGNFHFAESEAAGKVTRQAVKFLDKLTPPFFLYAHYLDPHFPYTPPKNALSYFTSPPPPEPGDPVDAENACFNENDFLVDQQYVAAGIRERRRFPPISDAGKEYARYLYDCKIRYMDAQLCLLLDSLRLRFPDTIIVILADHGEEFWEHKGMGHGTTMFSEQLDVPFCIQAPSLVPHPFNDTVSTIDLLPTLAGLLGFAPRAQWQGKDLFDPRRSFDEPLFSSTYGIAPKDPFHVSAVLQRQKKCVLNRETGKTMLFDEDNDPADSHNIIGDDRGFANTLRATLQAHEAACEAAAENTPSSRQTTPVDNATLERLKALGYGGSDAPSE